LDADELRILELRGLLGLLSDYGLSDRICRSFEVTDQDLEQLAMVEIECRALAKERSHTGDGANG
jgi:hypothetical protein